MRFSIVKPWTAVFLYYGLILSLSSIPRLHLPEPGHVQTDKFCHVLAYSGIGFLLARTGISWWQAFLAGICFGAMDEFYQLLVPGRSCSIYDWYGDCVGVAVGIIAWNVLSKSWKKLKN